jgi:serine/threonine-protein kinase
MTDQIGRVLGGRYRLLAPIGAGASAQVFLADDVRLRRRVAVKVLHDVLADDDAFLKRLRAEARAVAQLRHPNILAVYDWSGGDELPYLVSEFLGGGSLRAMLDQGVRLSPAQALLIGLDTAKALDHAHRRGFVHRDITPPNLLFDEDGRLVVADFGIARALAEAAVTEPAGAMLGTARYASPEQAQGESVTGRSDLYSLALVLIEAVTGEVPFARDTPLATLTARTSGPIPVPDGMELLAPALTMVNAVDPADRADAAHLAARFHALARGLEQPAALELAGAIVLPELAGDDDHDPTMLPGDLEVLSRAEGEAVVDEAPTPERPGWWRRARLFLSGAGGAATVGAIVDVDRDLIEVVDEAGGDTVMVDLDDDVEMTDEVPTLAPPFDVDDVDDAEAPPAAALEPSAAGDIDGRRRLRRRLLLALAGAGAAAVIAIVALVAFQVSRPEHEVPSLEALQISQIGDLVDSGDWDIRQIGDRADDTRPGQILAQDPPPGAMLREGDQLTLTVSRGPTLVAVPEDLAGLPVGEAHDQITAAGLEPGTVTEKFNELAPEGSVLATGHFFADLPKGDLVPLTVSLGPRPRTVPDGLTGGTFDGVASRLADVQLVAVRGEASSDSVPEGAVIRTEPGSGAEVPRDSEVVVVVSTGPPLVEIPDVLGDIASDVADLLEGIGLDIAGVVGSPNRAVVDLDPVPGSLVEVGTDVTIYSRFLGVLD